MNDYLWSSHACILAWTVFEMFESDAEWVAGAVNVECTLAAGQLFVVVQRAG